MHNALKKYRIQNGLTQKQVAERAKLQESAYQLRIWRMCPQCMDCHPHS